MYITVSSIEASFLVNSLTCHELYTEFVKSAHSKYRQTVLRVDGILSRIPSGILFVSSASFRVVALLFERRVSLLFQSCSAVLRREQEPDDSRASLTTNFLFVFKLLFFFFHRAASTSSVRFLLAFSFSYGTGPLR
jgi:hypothetical protein